MWTTWSDFDRHFNAINAFRGQLERAFGHDSETERDFASWPDARVSDQGTAYAVAIDVPGLTEDDLSIDLEDQTLTVGAKRTVDVPEGHTVVRAERAEFDWRRSVSLPGRVDAEKTVARLEHGVLTIALEKVPESQPRRISLS